MDPLKLAHAMRVRRKADETPAGSSTRQRRVRLSIAMAISGNMPPLQVPSENFDRIVAALKRLGFAEVRQRGSHIRLERQLPDRRIKITVPAQRPVKRSTLSHILKQAEVDLDDFLAVL